MNTEAARRIVDISAVLQQPMSNSRRNVLVAEQRTIWDALFPGKSYEQIVATIH